MRQESLQRPRAKYMVYLHITQSELDNALQKYGHLTFSKWPPAAVLELIVLEIASFEFDPSLSALKAICVRQA